MTDNLKLTRPQRTLADEVRTILAGGPKNTFQIARALSYQRSYDTRLRDRLLKLEEKGLIVSKTRMGQDRAIERTWSIPPDVIS